MQSFFAELKRRNVFRVGTAYLVASWLIIQLVETIFPAFGFGDGAVRIAVLVLGVGLIPVLILAWVYEMTPEGIKREKDVPADASIRLATGRKLDRVIWVVLSLSIILLLADRKWNTGEAPSAANSVATQSSSAGPQAKISDSPSIAVLPFANRSADASDEFFVEGIHDDILTQLAKIGELKVISRTSVMRYKDTAKSLVEIARELGVTSVVEGAVQRAGDRVRVTVQLINAATDEHLWAENYDRELTVANIFAIQSEVAATIARALETSLSPTEQDRIERQGTSSLAAYEAYTQGRYLFNRRSAENVHPALEKLQAAVALDPDYADAWVGLAAANAVIPGWTGEPPEKFLDDGAEAARRAIALDPTLGEPYAILSSIGQYRGQWLQAEEGYRKAISVDPKNVTSQHWYGGMLQEVGRNREAIAQLEVAEALDPAAPVVKLNKGWSLVAVGQVEEARALYQQLEQLQGFSPFVQAARVWIALREDRIADIRPLMTKAWEVAPWMWSEPVVGALENPALRPRAMEYLEKEAREIDSDLSMVMIEYAVLGAWDELFKVLTPASYLRSSDRSTFWQPEFAPARRDPRFKALMEELGMVDYWRTYGWPDTCKPVGNSFACE